MHLTARVRGIAESATLKATRRVLQMKAQGIDVIDFAAGEPDFPSPPVAVEAARRALVGLMHRPTAGPRILHRLAPAVEPGRYRRFGLEPVGATLGAFVTGLHLRAPLARGTPHFALGDDSSPNRGHASSLSLEWRSSGRCRRMTGARKVLRRTGLREGRG